MRPETLSIILNSLEIFRRGMWNCIRVEYKHLEISKEYRVSSDIELPFIKKGDRYYPSETNLIGVMGMNRDQKIKFELEKLFADNNRGIEWENKTIDDYTENVKGANEELRDYLKAYTQDTDQNVYNAVMKCTRKFE